MNASLAFAIYGSCADWGWDYSLLPSRTTVNYYEPMMTRKHRIKRQKNKRKWGAK